MPAPNFNHPAEPAEPAAAANPRRNGHAPEPPAAQAAPLAQPPAQEPQTTAAPASHISRQEEGPAAPGDALPRPPHPILGGSLYVTGIPSRDSRYVLTLTESVFRTFGENFPLRSAELLLLQDAARHGAQILRETQQLFSDRLKKQKDDAKQAQSTFTARAAEVRAAMQEATQIEREKLAWVEEEIAEVQYDSMIAHSSPGVPRALTARLARATAEENRVTQAGTANNEATGNINPAPVAPKKPEESGAETFTPLWIKVCKVGLGTAVGLAFGINQHFYTLKDLRNLDPNAAPWVLFWMMVGAFAISALTDGMFKLWGDAAGKCASESLSTRIINSHSIRHIILPFSVTIIICAMEASILRNAQVASPLIRDSGNWSYLFGNFALILPATLYAGISGWTHGGAQKRQQLREDLAEENSIQARTAVEEIISASAEAQSAFALADYAEVLQDRRAQVQSDIAEIEAPYRLLMDHYVDAMQAPSTIPDEEKQILTALREDAGAAQSHFLQKLVGYAEALEPLPNQPASSGLTLCVIRSSNQEPAPPVPPKKSLWARFKEFVGFKKRDDRNRRAAQ